MLKRDHQRLGEGNSKYKIPPERQRKKSSDYISLVIIINIGDIFNYEFGLQKPGTGRKRNNYKASQVINM
jgi:hypothetical protein